MKHLRIALLGILAVITLFGAYHFSHGAMGLDGVFNTLNLAPKQEASVPVATRPKPPLPDQIMTNGFPRLHPRPASAWLAKEKVYYEEILTQGQFDLLVVPFQVQKHALDYPTRSLMTAMLVQSISASQKLRIPDPYVVARALGEGERRLAPEDVYRLAEKMGVKRIVWGYVGHDLKYRMHLTIQHQDRPQYGFNIHTPPPSTTHDFDKVEFSDEIPPFERYGAILPDILKAIGISKVTATPMPISELDSAALPASPLNMVSGDSQPARDAFYLQLLASLTPQNSERTKERFIEKSLLAIMGMSPGSPDYRILKARALMGLGLRPAALKALGTPVTPDEKHLFALLNGNLREIENLASQIPADARGLLTKIERNRVKHAYGLAQQEQTTKDALALKLPGQLWPFFVLRALQDPDAWAQQENTYLKGLLDFEFPIPGFSAQDIVRGATTLGNIEKIQEAADLSVIEHLEKLQRNAPTDYCCHSLTAKVTKLDYLDFVQGIATDNLMRRAHFFTVVQGSPERALEFLSRIEHTFKDYPQYALLRAEAEFWSANRADGPTKEGLLKSAYTDAANALYWAQGQTWAAIHALHLFSRLQRQDYGYIGNLYVSDYPFRPRYPSWAQGENIAVTTNVHKLALNNATFEFEAAESMQQHIEFFNGAGKHSDEFIQSLSGRFIGHPARTLMLAQSARKKGEPNDAIRHYREAINDQPGYWPAYQDLSRLFFEDADVEQSARLLMSYPGFKKGAKPHPVELSNNAYEAGSLFFWSGHFNHAIPLYKIAADLRTGSDASLTSAIRLNLLKGNFNLAAQGSLERAQRYNSPYAYRDYLGLLHVMGYSKEAWDGFNVLLSRLDGPQIWETALVGHHVAGTKEGEIIGWINQDIIKKTVPNSNYPAAYLLRAGVTDRTPSESLIAAITDVEVPAMKDGRWIIRENRAIIGEIEPGPNDAARKGVIEKPSRVKSDLVLFAEGYRALRLGDISAAEKALSQASTKYQVKNVELGYVLPYYAFAAAKAGNSTAVDTILGNVRQEDQRFDYHLARAVLAGFAGNTEGALRSLDMALHRRPFTEKRPLYTEYQYAEICEWLYEATREEKYREIALNWAKKNQSFSPWFAWPYAMEAKLSHNPTERLRAMAITYYLDRNSERLASLSRGELQAARKQFGQINPFLKKNKAAPSSAI